MLLHTINATVISFDKLKELEDFIERVPEVDEFRQIIKKHSSSIVLIYNISSSAEDDNYFYNSALKPRKTKTDYKYGVTSGVVISKDGIIVTTYRSNVNADKFIVSIDSEKDNSNIYGKIIVSENKKEAEVIKEIPELNLLFLRIKANPGEEFDYMELGNDSCLKKDSWLIYGSAVIGKNRGEYFVTESRPKNNKNKFDIYSAIVNRLSLAKLKGIPVLIIYEPFTGEGVLPENDGGAVISLDGTLLGIACYKNNLNLPASFAIPISTIKKGLSIAFPGPIKRSLLTDIKINVEQLSEKQKRKLINCLNNSDILTKHLTEAVNNARFADKILIKTITNKNNKERLTELVQDNKLGISIKSLDEKSYAYQIGIRPNDILIKFHNDIVFDTETFQNLVNHSIEDQNLIITILRNEMFEEYELRK